jgi:hypothetical protein
VAKTSEGYGGQFLQAARAGQVLTDMYDLGSTLMNFTVADVARKITAPTLVTAYEGDTLDIPAAQQGSVLYRELSGRKEFHQFTAAEGAQFHCGPMAPQIRNQVVYDWIDGVL